MNSKVNDDGTTMNLAIPCNRTTRIQLESEHKRLVLLRNIPIEDALNLASTIEAIYQDHQVVTKGTEKQ